MKPFPSAASIREALAPTEAEVKASVCKWLDAHGYHWTRIQCGKTLASYKGKGGVRQRMIHMAAPGTADLLVILPPNGYALWIELKSNRKGSVQSPEQATFAAKMAALGAGYRIVRDVSEMPRVMAEELHTARAGARIGGGA